MTTRRITLAALSAVSVIALSGGLPVAAQTAGDAPAHVFSILPVKPEALSGFLPVIRANAAASREEPGNISFDVFQNEEGGSDILLFESWKSREAHNEHLQLPHLKAVEARAGTDFSGNITSVWVSDVPGLPAHARKPIPDGATTRNVLVRLRVKPEARDTFLKAFAEVIPASRAAPGNYVFDLYQETDDPNGFFLFERWQSVAAHEAHLGQPYSKTLDEVLPGTLAQPIERYLARDAAPASR